MRAESEIHAEMRALLDARRHIDPTASTPQQKRANWTLYTSAIALPRPAHIATRDVVIPMPAANVPARVYTSHKNKSGAAVVYLHGGGFMLGDLDSSDSIAWGLCDQVGTTIFSLDYRLTPDHPFPAAFDDCYGVLEHLHAEASAYDIEPSRIAFFGDSAGGSLTAACALAARDRNGPKMAAAALVYPTLGAPPTLPSYRENHDGPSLTTPSMIYYNDCYFAKPSVRDNPYAAPLSAPDFANLPPTFVHAAEFDPIRDDARLFAAKLATAGTEVTYREAKRMLHGFLRMREAGPDCRAEFAALCAFLRSKLGT